ncbi:synaptojanin-2-binding protein-like [Dreissena polymorpha]|uniref:PDZ domain-containing protein n=1 Tax=Dreissena polymorpha TaxID=45954 RepID=A0A9D4L8X7_DREPO|nr:synaptojanin-2-binding protein-like [Dreissena polymorpha]XP_052276230.1 synaptojanin-2-binding protein-like [Dreissena polymorpha]KAH3852827.1 hypothetical protein DPMN_095348 [Dreissena polymorpha]KAH3853473.1 hypothetical protein DPMN_095997 [Dreissena polymorpha]
MSDEPPLQKSIIILERGTIGLGFNIRGGVDNPHITGDSGIFVTKIRETGAAYRDGRLKEGDKILTINGTSLVNVSHSEAVQCFTNSKASVTLEVLHGAQDYILKHKEQKREEKGDKSKNSKSSAGTYVVIAAVVGVVVVGFIAYRKCYLRK